jgi:Uma2 family endonuclease
MGDPQITKRYTLAEYLELEEAAEYRSEFYNGEIYAMSGATPAHSRIASNCNFAMTNAFRGKGCLPYEASLKIYVREIDTVLHPDLSVICGPLEVDPSTPTLVENPTLILEVLSKSTSKYDRSGKFFKYRMIPSLQTFVMIQQSEPSVTVAFKSPIGQWDFTDYFGLEATVELRPLGVSITMKQIYEWIEF